MDFMAILMTYFDQKKVDHQGVKIQKSNFRLQTFSKLFFKRCMVKFHKAAMKSA